MAKAAWRHNTVRRWRRGGAGQGNRGGGGEEASPCQDVWVPAGLLVECSLPCPALPCTALHCTALLTIRCPRFKPTRSHLGGARRTCSALQAGRKRQAACKNSASPTCALVVRALASLHGTKKQGAA